MRNALTAPWTRSRTATPAVEALACDSPLRELFRLLAGARSFHRGASSRHRVLIEPCVRRGHLMNRARPSGLSGPTFVCGRIDDGQVPSPSPSPAPQTSFSRYRAPRPRFSRDRPLAAGLTQGQARGLSFHATRTSRPARSPCCPLMASNLRRSEKTDHALQVGAQKDRRQEQPTGVDGRPWDNAPHRPP